MRQALVDEVLLSGLVLMIGSSWGALGAGNGGPGGGAPGGGLGAAPPALTRPKAAHLLSASNFGVIFL